MADVNSFRLGYSFVSSRLRVAIPVIMTSMEVAKGQAYLHETVHCFGRTITDISHIIRTAAMIVLGRYLLASYGSGSPCFCTERIIMALRCCCLIA
ncbi:hypothetical protein Nepgr_013874 [Nepenthes gracilis]|uniref:Uncharacterized protein n=1 Tax=Nepenthes gracilis TaxID=150966 RepID=A0AAD3SIK6_NEPGR|nr:hypothetical protein Nepgr_013874 [Nepenthes gracilis]